jgi:hypothetical protein
VTTSKPPARQGRESRVLPPVTSVCGSTEWPKSLARVTYIIDTHIHGRLSLLCYTFPTRVPCPAAAPPAPRPSLPHSLHTDIYNYGIPSRDTIDVLGPLGPRRGESDLRSENGEDTLKGSTVTHSVPHAENQISSARGRCLSLVKAPSAKWLGLELQVRCRYRQ